MREAADRRDTCPAPRSHRLGSTGRTPRSPPRRKPPPPSPSYSAAPRRFGHDGLSPSPVACALSCRCADKDAHRSAERAPERESLARREYAWPDVPAGELRTKMGLRALGVRNVRLACFSTRVGITAYPGTEDCDGRLNLRPHIVRVPHLRSCLEPEMHVHFPV